VNPLLVIVGVALAALVIGWLVVSFVPPSEKRIGIEWLSALALYVALLTFFVHLVMRARQEDSTAGMAIFGFLAVMFAAGSVVTLVKTIKAFSGGEKTHSSATD